MVLALAGVLAGSVVFERDWEQNGFRKHWELAREPQFRCAGFFRSGPQVSGVWFYDQFVVTTASAAIDKDGTLRDPSASEFVITDGDGAEHAFRGRRWVVPSEYVKALKSRDSSAMDQLDIAVFELDRTPKVPGAAPAVIGFATPAKGDWMTFVGYGSRGITSLGAMAKQFGSGAADEPSRSMAARSQVVGLWDSGRRSWLKTDRGLPTALQGAAAPGDEGAGAFGYSEGEWKLLGLVTHGSFLVGGSLYGKGTQQDNASTVILNLGRFARPLLNGALSGNFAEFEKVGT